MKPDRRSVTLRCHLIFLAPAARVGLQSESEFGLALIADSLWSHGLGKAKPINSGQNADPSIVGRVGGMRLASIALGLWALCFGTAAGGLIPEREDNLQAMRYRDERRQMEMTRSRRPWFSHIHEST